MTSCLHLPVADHLHTGLDGVKLRTDFLTGGLQRLNHWEFKFDIQKTVNRDMFLQYNQREALISQIYFWNRTLHVSDSFSFHHQESSTVHRVIGICHTG